MLQFFAEKMWVAFALSAKNIKILYIESAKTVKEMTLNEIVKLTTLWTTGPWVFAGYMGLIVGFVMLWLINNKVVSI